MFRKKFSRSKPSANSDKNNDHTPPFSIQIATTTRPESIPVNPIKKSDPSGATRTELLIRFNNKSAGTIHADTGSRPVVFYDRYRPSARNFGWLTHVLITGDHKRPYF